MKNTYFKWSLREIPLILIEECHRPGYYVYAAGNMPQLIGHWHDDEYINSDCSDCEAILRTCSNLPQTWFFMFDESERSFVRSRFLGRLPVVVGRRC